jgi:hypothetical protein
MYALRAIVNRTFSFYAPTIPDGIFFMMQIVNRKS